MTPREIIESVGDIVIACSPDGYGTYIGELVNLNRFIDRQVAVKILACVEYPSQNALIYKELLFERQPYDFGTVHNFPIEGIETYYGAIPHYETSVKETLDTAIKNSGGIFLWQLRKHEQKLKEHMIAV